MISTTQGSSIEPLDVRNSGPVLDTTPDLPRRKRAADAFPWILFLLTWLATFGLENRMDAPARWLEEASLSDLAQGTYDGDMSRRILIVMLGAVGAFLLYRGRGRLRLNGTIATVLFAYLGWIGMSAAGPDDPSLTIRRLIAYALMLVFAAGCVARINNVDTLSLFIAGIPALNLIPGVVAELKYGNLHPFASGNRFGGTAAHPNVQAAGLSLAVILLCWLVWRARGHIRLALACTNVVVLAFLLMTRSRTSIIALAAAIGFSVLLVIARDRRPRSPGLIAALALTIGLSGLVGLAVTSNSVGPNLLNVLHADRDEGDPTTLAGRVDLWQTCLGFAAERPLLGFGFGGFWSPKHIKMISEDQQWVINQSHSAYLDQVLALGVPGAGLYILLLLGCLITCLVRFLRHQDRYGAWAAMLLLLAIHGVTESLNVALLFPHFAFNLIILHIALVKPRSIETLAARRLI